MFTCILVDDEKWVGVDLQKSVHWIDYGFNPPLFFQDSREAFERICQEKPDVVFTDIRMPGLSGIDLMTEMRKHNIQSEIVVLSAYEDFEAAQNALRLKVADYCLKPINIPEIECLLEALAEKIRIKKRAGKQEPPQTGEYSETIQKVIALLEENIGQKITLADVADKIFLNKNYLCSLFHEETGRSFSEYMTDLRITRARRLLQQTDLSIPEIAERLSYCDNFYFTKVFKKKVGVSPYAYKKSMTG
jgi:two-component system, response regulator YesN